MVEKYRDDSPAESSNELNDFDFMSEYSQVQKDLKDEERVQIDRTDLIPLDQ